MASTSKIAVSLICAALFATPAISGDAPDKFKARTAVSSMLALQKFCPDWVPDFVVLHERAVGWGINLAEGSEDYVVIQHLARESAAKIEAEGIEQGDACKMTEDLFGPMGAAGAGLMKRR